MNTYAIADTVDDRIAAALRFAFSLNDYAGLVRWIAVRVYPGGYPGWYDQLCRNAGRKDWEAFVAAVWMHRNEVVVVDLDTERVIYPRKAVA